MVEFWVDAGRVVEGLEGGLGEVVGVGVRGGAGADEGFPWGVGRLGVGGGHECRI